jgi:hypothetical protein
MAYTLDNLRTNIRDYTEVDSGVLSDTVLDTIIKNAENRIYRESDSDDNRFYATSTLISGNRYVTIPSDLRIIRYVQLKDASGNQTYLQKRDTSFMSEFYNTPGTASGLPKYYGNWDANFWLVAPTPNSNFEITLAYVKQPISITSTTQPTTANPASNVGTYVSNKYQDLLLYACLVEAYGYLKGPADMLQYYEASFRRAMQSYSIEQQGRRRRDEYQDGAIRTPIRSEPPSKY